MRLLAERSVALEPYGPEARFHVGAGNDAAAAWACFAQLAATPVEPMVVIDDEALAVEPDRDGDRLLFETIVRPGLAAGGWDGEEVLRGSCSRNFLFTDADGEDAGMNHCTLAFEAPASDAARAVADVQLWGYAGEHAKEWLTAVERSPAFAVLMDASTRFWVLQSAI